MLDRDLAKLYDVTTAAFNQAVRRNRDRFPEDFMFQLTPSEVTQLNRSQIVIGSEKHRDPRFRPYAFTEQGVARSACSFGNSQVGKGGSRGNEASPSSTPTMELRAARADPTRYGLTS